MIEPLDPDIAVHYQVADERARLRQNAAGQLELVRTQEILRRYLPTPPGRVLDVGGGPGIYARWLAADGYDVELFDPVELHVQQAQAATEDSERAFVARLGDARNLPVPDVSSDAVLLLGPLYHLNAGGRALALAEAARVVRPSGLVVAAAISRFASLLDGLVSGWLGEEDFLSIVRRDLAVGEHSNPDPVGRPEWFTTAWFHRPEELRKELVEAGLAVEARRGAGMATGRTRPTVGERRTAPVPAGCRPRSRVRSQPARRKCPSARRRQETSALRATCGGR